MTVLFHLQLDYHQLEVMQLLRNKPVSDHNFVVLHALFLLLVIIREGKMRNSI